MGVSALFAYSHLLRPSSAAGINLENRRLFVVVLRGGLDGLAAVAPIGDPAFEELRGRLLRPDDTPLLILDGMFALNGNMPRLTALYQSREALIVHAAATPYRDRSHFEAQDMLESGAPALAAVSETGWLNRALQSLPKGERLPPANGLALEPTIPLIMRGIAPINTWQPQLLPLADADTIQRVVDLYRSRDPDLASALERGVDQDLVVGPRDMGSGSISGKPDLLEKVHAGAMLMARPDGPRIAMMSLYGWDTHHSQGFEHGVIAKQLRALDEAVGGLKDGLATVWDDTAVLIVTEFGRTVRFNGSAGTDHGTATVAFLVGGAVHGGRVIADWPGLAERQLYQGRDLRPTTDLRALVKGVLSEHLGITPSSLDGDVFPGSENVSALTGLCRRI
jgi:uncharacterized protein (DUF1501 family)